MKENLYQLIKDRETHFPEGTIRNMLFQVRGLTLRINNRFYFISHSGFKWIGLHASAWLLP